MKPKPAWLVLVLLAVLLSACTATGPAAAPASPSRPSPAPTSPSASAPATASPSAPSAAPTGAWSIVALGDSVPAGTACGCTPYPQLSAAELTSPTGPPVRAVNDAVAGFTTVDVLHQLNGAGAVIRDVRAARLVEVEVGANDVAPSGSCGTDAGCYLPEVPQVRANLRAIVTRLHDLTVGHPVKVVLLDYWSVWLGGKYARQQGEAYVDAAATVTDRVNTAIRQVAAQAGAAYVDLRAAFKGPDYSEDDTRFLAADGDHPNAAGHRKIASALVMVVRSQMPGLLAP
jgi:lysophospholipase L1-like esterase